MGNICRSPTAEAVMAHLVDNAGLAERVIVDSAGTGSWHVGEPPDHRATAEATRRGVPMRGTAVQFQAVDFARFDLVLAMDADNRRHLERLAPDAESRAKVRLLRSFDPEATGDLAVPDPYYGGTDGFRRVFDMVEAACRGLLDHLRDGPLLDGHRP
ncbi:MAG: low molecular weight protein-tyrosine-phosphatase [Actinomycetota bacterium]